MPKSFHIAQPDPGLPDLRDALSRALFVIEDLEAVFSLGVLEDSIGVLAADAADISYPQWVQEEVRFCKQVLERLDLPDSSASKGRHSSEVLPIEELLKLSDPGVLDYQVRLMGSEIIHMEHDLGSGNRLGPDGHRLSFLEYDSWRHRAKTALRHKLEAYRLLKLRVKELNYQQYLDAHKLDAPKIEGSVVVPAKQLRRW